MLPGFFEQRQDNTAVRFEYTPVTFSSVWTTLGKLWVGHPSVALDTVPGFGGVLIAAGVLAAVLALVPVARERGLRAGRDFSLIVVVAVASPIGALVYSLGPENVYGPRYLIPSLPALALATGALLGAPRRPWIVASATALVLAGLLVGTVRTLQPSTQRARFDEVARDLDRNARAYAPVIEASIYHGAPSRQLGFYFKRPHDYFPNGRPLDAAFAPGPRTRDLFFVAQTGTVRGLAQLFGLRRPQGYREVARRDYPGAPALTLLHMRRPATPTARR